MLFPRSRIRVTYRIDVVSEPVECLIPSSLIPHHITPPQIKQNTKATVVISRKMYPFSTFTASFAKGWLKWLYSLSVSDGVWLQGLADSCTHEHETQQLAQQEHWAHWWALSCHLSTFFLVPPRHLEVGRMWMWYPTVNMHYSEAFTENYLASQGSAFISHLQKIKIRN